MTKTLTPTVRWALSCLFIALIGVTSAVAQQNRPDDAAVERYFPQWITDESQREFEQGGNSPIREFGYEDFDLNGTGAKNFVVAVYSNGFRAGVAVLQRSGVALAQVAAPALRLSASKPTIRGIDVDSDGKVEVVIELVTARGNQVMWVLKWDGITLSSIGPELGLEFGPGSTALCNTDLIDLDGDGKLEAVNSAGYAGQGPHDPNAEDRWEIFRLDASGKYSPESSYALHFDAFQRYAGAPKDEEREFVVGQPGPGFRLRVVNGAFGAARVSSATIRFNGAVVAGPERFSQNVGYITLPITAQTINTLIVTVNGAPGGQVLLALLPPGSPY